MRSLKMTSSDSETTSQFGTWKQLHESCQRLWQLQRIAGKARNMTKNALYILIVIFLYNSNKTSDRKLCIYPAWQGLVIKQQKWSIAKLHTEWSLE